MNSRPLQPLSGSSLASCGGRDAAAAPAPPCGGSGNTAAPSRAGKMAPGSSRRLQGQHCELLPAYTYTHGTKASPALLLAPVHTRRLQLAPALPAQPEGSPLPLADASPSQAAILPLPLATAITRSAARPLRASRGQDGTPSPRSSDSPPLLRHLSSSAANSHGHGLKNALSAMRGYRSFSRLARLCASPSRRFQNLPLRKDIQHPPRATTGGSAWTCADDSSLLVILSPEKIHSVYTSKRVSLLKSKL